jgi:hypothetical protein
VGVGVGKKGVTPRWSLYRRLRGPIVNQPELYNALRKYGPENFKYDLVVRTDDPSRALQVEAQLIALWNLTNRKYGYNMTKGGLMDKVHYAEKCEKLRNKATMVPKRYGYKHTEEAKRRMSEGRMGLVPTDITRAKLSAAKRGNTNTLGKVFPPEMHANCTAAQLKRWAAIPPEKRNLSAESLERRRIKYAANRECTIANMKAAQKLRYEKQSQAIAAGAAPKPRKEISEDTRQRMRESSRRRWASQPTEVSCAVASA